MNNLEWINAEIEKTKSYLGIAQCNEVMFGDENNEVYKMLKNQLTHLNQIKNILEAWEVIKGNLVLNEENSNVKLSVCYRTKNYNKIKKALEGKDE